MKPLSLADVIHQFSTQLPSLPWPQQKVLNHIVRCRTAALGGTYYRCSHCGEEKALYHSCRDRHCPTCQYQATQRWYEQRQADLLPVTYHHLVFTLPHELNGWVSIHDREIYRLLFHCAWQCLKAFGKNPKRLNGEIGMMSVLHTWGESLTRHVHLHCLVPGGALQGNGHWQGTNLQGYLFPVKALSNRFRGLYVSGLRQAFNQGELPRLDPSEFDCTLSDLMSKAWVVYSKPVLTEPERVLGYLGRYTRRIGLSNGRSLGMTKDSVNLQWKDYRAGAQRKVMRLDGVALLQRFLLHVLPKGFMRIRYYGFLANVHRRKKLAQIRETLGTVAVTIKPPQNSPHADHYRCQHCGQGVLLKSREIPTMPTQYKRRLTEPLSA